MNLRQPKTYSTSTTVSYPTVMKRDVLIADTAGICLTLPDPVGGLTRRQVKVCNTSAGYVHLACTDGFLASLDGITLPPYSATQLQVVKSSSAYKWSATGEHIAMTDLLDWTPTLTFTTGTPTIGGSAVSPIFNYVVRNGFVFFVFYVAWDDGNGATQLAVSLPAGPRDLDGDIPCPGYMLVDTTYTECGAYIDQTNATEATRNLTFKNFQTCTDAKAGHIAVAGFYDIGGGVTPRTPAHGTDLTWGTAAPANETYVFKEMIDNLASIWYFQASDADSNACSGLSIQCPQTPPDNDIYPACRAIEYANDAVTYKQGCGHVDCANATAESRVASFKAFTTCTDGQAVKVMIAAITAIAPWNSFTPSLTWGTADPGTITKAGRYHVSDGICYFQIYITSADGNGATSLVIDPPVTPKLMSMPIPIMSTQLQNATYSDAAGFIDASEDAGADRTIQFRAFSTATDAQTVSMFITGWYPVQ